MYKIIAGWFKFMLEENCIYSVKHFSMILKNFHKFNWLYMYRYLVCYLYYCELEWSYVTASFRDPILIKDFVFQVKSYLSITQ